MKLFDHLPHGTVTVVAILVGVFVIYQSGVLNKAVSIAENAANNNSKDVLALKKSFQQKIADKDKKITLDSQKVVNLSLSVRQLKAQNDSLKVNLASAKTPQDTILAQNTIIVNLSQQNDSLTKKCAVQDTIISTCAEQKRVMQVRIDTLEFSLAKQVESTKCHILLFGCPTRTAMFEAGGVLGILTVLIIKSLVH
jgi:hypothetical protein